MWQSLYIWEQQYETKLHSQRQQEQIKFRKYLLPLSSELLSSCLLFKNVKIKMYKTIILPLVFIGVKLGLSY
jgi:hypothetical protein